MKLHPLTLLLACSVAGAAEPVAPDAPTPPQASTPVKDRIAQVLEKLRSLQFSKGDPSTAPVVFAPTCYFLRTIRPVDPSSTSSGFVPLQYRPTATTQSICTVGGRTLQAQRPAPSTGEPLPSSGEPAKD
jgi:hypothetical protein